MREWGDPSGRQGARGGSPRVLIVASEFPPGPGGIGTHAYQMARELGRLGWNVVVATSQDYASDGEIAAFNDALPFRVVRLRSRSAFALKLIDREATLFRWLGRHSPQVIVASGTQAVLLVASRWRGRRVPLVAIGHGSEFSLRGWQGSMLRRAFRHAAAVICVSGYTRRRMHAVGIHPSAEFVVPNGADRARFGVLPAGPLDEVASLGLEPGPLLVTVGHVSARKGQDVAVRALPAVLRRFPDTQYLIVGLPTEGAKILDLASRLGVSSHVHLLGRVPDDRLARLLNACEVFVLTSRETGEGDFEGYGIAVVEAALCGKPAVVSGDSGLAEAVIEGETGLVVPQDDEKATAGAILALLENSAMRHRMGERARERAESEQTWEQRIRRYDEILRQSITTSTGVRGQALGSAAV